VSILNLTIDARFRFDENCRLNVQVLDPKAPGIRALDLLPSLIGYRIRKAEKIFRRIFEDDRDIHYFRKGADGFRLTVMPGAGFEERIPRNGPLIVVANHPLNGIDGMAIAAALCRVRPDLKVMLTTTFDGIPGLKEHAIFVNASNGPSAKSRTEPVREAIAWLKQGHALILFPAGQGSYISVKGRKDPVDVEWNTGVAMLLKSSRAHVLPVYVFGRPSFVFLQTRKLYHPLATLFLLREILIQEGSKVLFGVGDSVSYEQIAAQGDRHRQVDYLRSLTYALADSSNDP
jgi:putative hemolysin